MNVRDDKEKMELLWTIMIQPHNLCTLTSNAPSLAFSRHANTAKNKPSCMSLNMSRDRVRIVKQPDRARFFLAWLIFFIFKMKKTKTPSASRQNECSENQKPACT